MIEVDESFYLHVEIPVGTIVYDDTRPAADPIQN
jgi:hypothetical protein